MALGDRLRIVVGKSGEAFKGIGQAGPRSSAGLLGYRAGRANQFLLYRELAMAADDLAGAGFEPFEQALSVAAEFGTAAIENIGGDGADVLVHGGWRIAQRKVADAIEGAAADASHTAALRRILSCTRSLHRRISILDLVVSAFKIKSAIRLSENNSVLAQIIAEYNEAIFDTDRDRALQIVREAELKGISPEDIVFKIVLPAMDLMQKSMSEDSGVNLAQHFITAQIADAVTAEMVAKFSQAPAITGCVVIGTAAGDMHSLGKRIVKGCLRARMIEVRDLGINVSAERFVDEAVAHAAEVIAISAMMVHTARSEAGCLKVRKILQDRDLESRIRIVVGGAPFRFDPDLYQVIKADAWGEDAIIGAKVIEQLIQKTRK